MFIADNELSISALLLAACLACSSVHAAERLLATAPASGKLLISGSSAMAPMMVAVGKRFSTLHPGVQIDVQVTGSGRGVDDVTKGKADIGMASRALTNKESSLYSFAIARDGVGLVVHKNNPVKSLSNQQVVDIYSGKIKNWRKVGGQDTPIALINAKEDAGTVELFIHYFDLKYADIKEQSVVGDNMARIRALIDNPHGIAYLSFGAALRAVNRGAPIKLLPIDGVTATTKNIRNGNFPLSRPLLLLTRDLPTGLVKDFINFSLSSQITEIVVQHELVPYLD